MSQSDFVNRGQALVASGQYQEAVKVCRLGLLGRPTTVEGRVVLGQALLALKRFDEVLAEMRVAIELDHTSVAALVLKGEALLRKGDHHAAIETLSKARMAAPTDRQIAQLMSEAERATAVPVASTSHPAVGFVRQTNTRNYPQHQGEEDTGSGSYTRPTSLASPGSRDGQKSARHRAVKPPKGATPGATELAVGDKSGTVEVDPELEGVELDDDDLGALSPPPATGGRAPDLEVHRGSVKKAGPRSKSPTVSNGKKPAAQQMAPRDSGMELDADDLIDVDEETPPPREPPKPRSQVRASVGLMSGPLDQQYPMQPQASLAQAIAGTPHVMQVTPVAASPQVNGLAVPAAGPRSPTMVPQQMMPLPPMQQQMPGQSTLPGQGPMQGQQYMPMQGQPMQGQPMQGQQMPMQPMMYPPGPQPTQANFAAAAMKTQSLNAAQMQSANAVDEMFQNQPQPQPAPAWAKSTVAGSPNGMPPSGLDPALAALAVGLDGGQSGQMVVGGPPVQYGGEPRPMKTGMRKTRSPLRVVVWIILGAAVIGGGVFAGFQIRAMRLGKQIDAARERATDLAKSDTWGGWAAARDGLAGIVLASNTGDNRAALARTRASIAFELGDGLADAKTAVDALKGEGGLDGQLAVAYLALAQDDPKTAKTAADAALALAPTDAAALYVAGQAQHLAGDASGAVAHLKAAIDADPRALYAVGLARTLADANAWDDALAAAERALKESPDNPAALIARAEIDVHSGRIPKDALASDMHSQLDKVITEGGKPLAEQTRGVSPEQVALANLALAQLMLARGNPPAALAATKAALALDLDDQRVVEGIIEMFVALDDPKKARGAAEKTLEHWPNSRRARIALARALTALGKPEDALATIAKSGEVTTLPLGLVARGEAKLATGDVEGARADFDAALKHEPKLEAAIVGRVTLDVATAKIDDAHKLIDPRFAKDPIANAVTLTAYASVLRASGDAAQRAKAQDLLEKLTAAPLGPDTVRATVELGRIYRDSGDLRAARDAFAKALSAAVPDSEGSVEARLESGLLQIEDLDPVAGLDTLEQLLHSMGDSPPANILLETARARMLVGKHAEALAALDQAEKARGLVHWQLDRERGRLAFRRGDIVGAAQALTRALETCGADPETFLLAADVVYTDVVSSDDKTPARFADLSKQLEKLSAERLDKHPEGLIVTGILALANGKSGDAEAAYTKAGNLLDAEKATPRRLARVSYGVAILAYNVRNLPLAKRQLDLVIGQDPSSYSAYLYRADVEADRRDPAGLKLAYADAMQAVAYNPDLVDGWYFVGRYAHDLGDAKQLAVAKTKINEIAPDSPHLRELQLLQ